MALAFVDDSGNGGDSPYFVLAGYTASESTWAAFVPRWQAVLELPPKLQYFKMAEAESLKGQFAEFDKSARDARLRDFIDVIVKCELWEAAVAIPAKGLLRSTLPSATEARTSPYYAAFIAMVTALSGMYRWSGSQEVVDFVFDEQDGMRTKAARLYHQFRGWYSNWRLGRVGFGDEKKILPLQAADLVAWQTRRFMCSNEGTRDEYRWLHSVRRPFRATVKRSLLEEMAKAIRANVPKLREEFGDERVDHLLAGIERRNKREEISEEQRRGPTNRSRRGKNGSS